MYIRLKAAIFDSPFIPTPESKTLGLAFEILLLFRIKLEMCVMVPVLSVIIDHVWYTNHHDVGEYSHQSCRATEPWKYGVAVGISSMTTSAGRDTW